MRAFEIEVYANEYMSKIAALTKTSSSPTLEDVVEAQRKASIAAEKARQMFDAFIHND